LTAISSIHELLPLLMRGAGITVQLTVMSAVLALIVAFVAGFGRLSKLTPVRWLTGIFVEVMRGTSLLVQLFWFFFVLPFFGIKFPAMVVGVIALGLNYGAYASEVVRSSIQAVPKGQIEAAIALNMTPGQRMRHVILPQALMLMIPPFGNQLIEMLKGTALVSMITVPELMRQGNVLISAHFSTERVLLVYGLEFVIYFIIAYAFTLGMRWLERRVTVGRS